MSGLVAKHNLFRPKLSKVEPKADITDHTARLIIRAEIERRGAKAARLRQARLEAETKLATVAAPAKPRRVSPATPRLTAPSM